MTTDVFDSDQTEFAALEPYLEVGTPVKPMADELMVPKPWYKNTTRLLIVGGLGLLVAMVSIMAILRMQNAPPALIDNQVTPAPASMAPKTVLDQKLDSIALELLEANPLKPPVTFPVVDMKIQLEEAR